jgi:serine phosphatase RsbU (regulator of sigma subunit)
VVNNTVRYIFEDRKGNLWFGTNNQGVSCYIPGENNEDGMVVTYTTDHGLPLGTVWSILEDRSGCLWFGCTNGLARFDGKSFTTYTTNQGMVDNIVGPITEDKNGNIWIGTGNGLSCFVNKTSFLTYTTAQGLGDNVIYDMEIGSAPGSAINEKKNALYLGTNQGFSVLTGFKDKKGHVFSFEDLTLYKDPDLKNFTPVFEIYNNKTGYLIKDLNTNALCITKTGLPTLDEKVRSGVGIIWGGCGDDKVVRFDPFSVNKNNIPLKVIIQGVKINEEKISWYNLFQSDRETAKSDSLAAINEEVITFGNALTIDERDTLQKRFGDIKFDSISRWYPVPQNLALPYNHNNITFDFAAIETDKHFLVRYQYILEGYDKSWSPITDKSSVTFGNIYEGMYTFRLKACSPAGIWCEPIVYTFKVLPPWWRTWWMYAVYSLSVMSLIAGVIKWRERNLKKEKALLEQKVELRTKELDERNKVVEEKNKDILDSIHYAKRIQDALLKEEEHTSPHLPDHFVLFIPKDIVSGDFHWAMEKEDHWYVAAVDCTGHGVPGAFMSMLGMSFLNDIVSGTELLIPAEILNRLRDKIVKELRQTGESGGSKDGMDISLIRLNLKTKELQWAGANNALTVVKNGNMNEIKADKQPIGYHPEQKKFTNHTVQLYSGESVYIYTDGYADQFGGPKGKKFKYKQLEHLILENNQLPLIKQKELLKKTFNDWKGNLEQLDDVCIIGVKV